MSSAQPETVIIDCDPGVDDMMALLLALSAPELNVIGITVVMGNSDELDTLARNACFAQHICGRGGSIPVYKGRGCLEGEYHGESGKQIHGPNGIGGVPVPADVDTSCIVEDVPASQYIRDTVLASPGEVTLLTLGPLSNVGEAIQAAEDPAAVGAAVKRVVAMLGCFNMRGNKAPIAEANANNDPEAAKIVFGAVADITVLPLDCTHQLQLPVLLERLSALGTPVGDFCVAIAQHYVEILTRWGSGDRLAVHDPSAAMFLLRPELFGGERARVDVETAGDLTRGATVADWLRHWGKLPKQTLVVTRVDAEGFMEEYMARVGGLSWSG